MLGNENTRKLINEVTEKLVRQYRPNRIVLFGSYAYGDPDEDSDIDLLIIKNTDSTPMERWMELQRLLMGSETRVSISPLVYTEQELAERVRIRDFFIREVLEKGEVLYG